MSQEVSGTLNDVCSLNDQKKKGLVNLSVTAATDVANKKAKNNKPKKTTVNLGTHEGVIYQLIAVEKKKESSRTLVEKSIKAMGLDEDVINRLMHKYVQGAITRFHVSDINKVNCNNKIAELDLESQSEIVDRIIINRNSRYDINSSETALYILKGNNGDKNDADSWYREVLRLIKKLTRYADINPDTVVNLSSNQTSYLLHEIYELNSTLQKLTLLLRHHQ